MNRFLFFSFILFLLVAVFAEGLAVGMPQSNGPKVIQPGGEMSWVYTVSSKRGSSRVGAAVESELVDYITVSPAALVVGPGKPGKFRISVKYPDGFSPGLYPVKVSLGESPENKEGIIVAVGAGDVQNVVIASPDGYPYITEVRCKGISLFNVGLKGLTGISAFVEVSQNGEHLLALRSEDSILPSLKSKTISFDLSDAKLSKGEYELVGSLMTAQATPVSFSKRCSFSVPQIHVYSQSEVYRGPDQEIPIAVNLSWNVPVEVKFATLSISDEYGLVFSDSKPQLMLQPGENSIQYRGPVNIDATKNYSGKFSYQRGDKIEEVQVKIPIVFSKPKIQDRLNDAMVSGIATVQESRNLQILLLVLVAMVFSSAFTIAIFKKQEDEQRRNDEIRLRERKKFAERYLD